MAFYHIFMPLRSSVFMIIPVFILLSCQSREADSTAEGFHEQAPEKIYPGLFEAAQTGEVFPDSKTFADAIPIASTDQIMAAYETSRSGSDFEIASFVNEWFLPPAAFASGFRTDPGRSPAEHINSLWPILTREADTEAKGSLIPLPYPYIVPGGRFGEIYYWDSYFTMLGLRVSDSHAYMIRHMVDNFAYLIDTIGFIPNGNRTYFLGRSQPPFFSLMVRLLADTDSAVSLSDYLPQLLKEYRFWMAGEATLSTTEPVTKRVVRMPDGRVLNRYWDHFPEPRPESYKEDVELAMAHPDRNPEDLYRDLRAACESGWDFSSRWLRDPEDLSTIHTTDILPVDLNALLWHLEQSISEACYMAGDEQQGKAFAKRAQQRKTCIQTLFWDNDLQIFTDYDWKEGSTTGFASLAMSYPLLLHLASQSQAQAIAQRLETEFLVTGGLLTTLNLSGQQWDAPNAWAPLQYISIAGLNNYGFHDLADSITERWMNMNRAVYQQTGKMTEKYNALETNLEAGGGEYPVQDGFGWTNGVLLHLIKQRKDLNGESGE